MGYTFISGSTGGLGKAYAKKCASLGYDMFLTGRSEEKLSSLKTELLKINGKLNVEYFACDLTEETSRKNMIEYIDGKGIKFERVLNVAGVDIQKAFTEYTLSKVQFQIRVNVEATLCITYELLKRKAESMEILTVSSMSGVSPMPYFAIYSASKGMLTSFFTSLHYELKGKGIKVTTVMPGGIPTREDIKKDIKGQGLWGKLSAKPPEYVVEKSLKALRKNKVKCIPGFFNRFLYVIMKISPKRIVLKFIAKRWSKISKDAF